MSGRKKIGTIIVVELISLIVTFAIFFLTEWGMFATAIDATSLMFVVLAELTCFTSIILLSLDSCELATAFGWSGFTTSAFLYFVFTLFMTFIRHSYFDDTQKFVLHQIVGLSVFGIVMLLVYLSASKVKESNEAMSAKFESIQRIEDRIMELSVDSRWANYKEELDSLFDIVLYADKSVKGEIDSDIEKTLSELEQLLKNSSEDKDETVLFRLRKLRDLFSERQKGYVRNNRGGF